MFLLYHAYVYLEFLILACTIYILAPLDENEEPYDPCNIDEIAGVVRIVEVKEVSNHYE